MRYFDFLVPVEEFDSDPGIIHVYPAVFNDRINIEIQETNNNLLEVQLFHTDGTCEFHEKFNYHDHFEIEPGNISNGLYILRLITKGRIHIFKLIKI